MDSKQKRIIIEIQLGRKNLNSGLKKIRDEWDFKSIEQGIEQIIKINTVSGRQLKNDILPCSQGPQWCQVHKKCDKKKKIQMKIFRRIYKMDQ